MIDSFLRSIVAVCIVSVSCFALIPACATAEKLTTIAEIMAGRDTTTPDKKKPSYCNGGVFKPCVCAKDVSKKIIYRARVRQCGGKAAIILTGKYAASFSAVIRTGENADRIPANALINGCSVFQRDVLGLNKCSVYKAQKIIKVEDDRGQATVHCLGASGYSSYFAKARRLTVKLANSPTDTSDPLVRACLYGPTKDLN